MHRRRHRHHPVLIREREREFSSFQIFFSRNLPLASNSTICDCPDHQLRSKRRSQLHSVSLVKVFKHSLHGCLRPKNKRIQEKKSQKKKTKNKTKQKKPKKQKPNLCFSHRKKYRLWRTGQRT